MALTGKNIVSALNANESSTGKGINDSKDIDILFTLFYNKAMKKLFGARGKSKYIIELYLSNPLLNIVEIAGMYGVSKQRVSYILRKYKAVRNCNNCYHFQEFKHCSCKEETDIVKTDNKCQDWLPV